jgi:hypothetical protein
MHFSPRPVQMKIALVAALLAVATDVFALILSKAMLGDRWFGLVLFSTLRYLIYLFLLALAYNGRGWVRYVYVLGVVLSVYGWSRVDDGAFGNPWVVIFLVFSAIAVVAWFSDSAQAWYRSPWAQTHDTSLERTRGE